MRPGRSPLEQGVRWAPAGAAPMTGAGEAPGRAGDRPRLVFFQWDHAPNLAGSSYLLLHMQAHVRCLSTHFDVTVINRDCDFAEVCDRHQPDLVLFEAGYRSHGSRRIRVDNTAAHPGVPRLGLHNGDPWCDRRAGFLSDMDRWGIETFFSICTLTPSYTPAVADRMFVWPNFIDPEMFRDQGEAKRHQVFLTGQAGSLYPWRQAVFPRLAGRYDCLVSGAAAYGGPNQVGQLVGEDYARALNASLVVPTCGTLAGEVVRKHFEIPASMACLVTERTAALEAAGFVDGETCVFAAPDEVEARLDALFADPEALRRITEAGHRLVMARHTLRHRPQIHQWLMLSRALGPGQKIIQPGPFDNLTVVDERSGGVSGHIAAVGLDRRLIRQADALAAGGHLAAAGTRIAACLERVPYHPEARLRQALLVLARGDAAAAQGMMARIVEVTMLLYGAADPDPTEWAMYLLTLICQGRLAEARRLLDRYPRAWGGEMDRVARLLDRLAPDGARPAGSPRHRRASVHVAIDSDAAWNAWVAGVLAANGQGDLAARLTGGVPADGSAARGGRALALVVALDRALDRFGLDPTGGRVPPGPGFDYPRRTALRLLGRTRLRRLLKDLRDRIRPPRAAPDAGRANAPAMPELPAAGPAGWPLVPPVIPLPPAAGPEVVAGLNEDVPCL